MNSPKHYLLVSLAGTTLLIPVVALAIAGLVLPTHTPTVPPCHQIADQSLAALADKAADRHDIPRDIFAALIQQESAWNPDAVSSAGAIGLTQVMPRTGEHHCGLTADQLTDPESNLDCGASYLSAQFKVFGDWRLALAGYNAGPSRVISAGGIPAIAETQHYVQTICAVANCGGAA